MIHKYFVSYFWKRDGEIGFGSTQVNFESLITDYSHINSLKEIIEKEYNNSLTILNYQLLGKSEY